MPDPTRILHMVPTKCDWESAQRIASLAAALREHGLTTAVTAPDNSRLWEFAEASGVEVLGCSLENTLNPLRWLEVSRFIKQYDPGLIHIHSAEAARLLSRSRMFSSGIPCVTTRYDLRSQPTPAEFGPDIGAVICPSRAVADAFGAAKAADGKIHVIPDGIAMPMADRAVEERDRLRLHYRDAYCPDKEKPLFIVNIAPLEKESGQADILEAMSEIVAVLPQCHLFIMGEGPEMEELRRQIRITALEKDVDILEPDKAFFRLLAAADLAVSATRDDVSGLMIQAAMASGRATALWPAGCYDELVESGKDGLVATEASAQSLKTAMLDLLENRGRREQVGRLAHAKAAKTFDMTNLAGRITEIYGEVMAAHSAGPA